MYTYKFVGLQRKDSPTRFFYGSLPAKPEIGHTLSFKSGNRYRVIAVEGRGLVGKNTDDDLDNQKELAWAEINRNEAVPTVQLRSVGRVLPRPRRAPQGQRHPATLAKGAADASFSFKKDRESAMVLRDPASLADIPATGRSFEYEELKEQSQKNKKAKYGRRAKAKKP